MSSSWWPRRPSAPDTTVEPPSPSRQRTTSGSMAVLASALGLSKHKSRERLRVGTSSLPNRTASTPPALVSSSRPRSANNRQTVVSTGSSDYPEPTTPSSASDTKRSFQSSSGPGIGVPGDDPFARAAPVYVAESSRKKEKQPERPQERVRKLGVSQGEVRRVPSGSVRPSTTHRAYSGGAESHLSPPTHHLSSKTSLPHLSRQPSSAQLSPGSSTSHLSPKSSSSYLSASTAPTTFSNSSTLFSGFSPTTSPIALSPTSALDIYAHATATQSYSYSPDSNPSPLEEAYARAMASTDRLAKPDEELDLGPPALGIRRGQSAHAVLSRPSVPNLSTQPSNPSIGVGRGGRVAEGMGSMVALASGIVQEVREVPALNVPKRPSRSELRTRTSSSSLVNPPPRTSSRRGSENDTNYSRRGSENDTSTLSVPTVQERADEFLAPPSPHSSQSGSPGPSNVHLYSPPPSNASLSPGPSNLGSPRSSPVNFTPGASRHATPTARKSEDLDNYQFAPITHDEASIDLTALGFEDDVYSDTESRFGLEDPRFGMDDPRLALDDSKLGASPRFGATLHPNTAMHPDPLSLIDPENIQLDGHPLLPPESPRSGTKYARSPSIRPVHLPTNPPSRPPPSPTNLPWMAGNAGRRRKLSSSEVAYPSGMHTIPVAAKMELARLGKEEDAVRGIGIIEEGVDVGAVLEAKHEAVEKGFVDEGELVAGLAAGCLLEFALEDDEFPTPPASAPPSSPSPVNPLTRVPSASSRTSSCSSMAPEATPETVSSRIEFSRHARSGSYSDSEVDLDPMPRTRTQVVPTQTAVAWKCGSGNHEKCCSTRALREGVNAGRWKCCADRTSGKNARCCAAVVGLPCQRPRVSSTSSASVHEAGWGLKRQRSYHMPTLPGMGVMGSPGPSHARGKRFFHRPHTSHAKSTSSALLDDETKSIIRAREDPGPSIATVDEVFAPIPVASPPISPMSRHEFRAQHIISPAALQDHLKEMRSPLTSPAPPSEPGLKSPKLEPTRQRSNTTTTNVTTTTDTTGSIRSTFSDSPAPMRSLPLPRRTHNASLPVMTSSQAAPPPRRYVQSISTVIQPSRAPPPPPRSPIGSLPRPPLGALPPVQRASAGSGLPPPPRGRVGTQPIVSFISSHSAPTPTHTSLRHHSSRESCASSSTVRRERSIPLRENQMSFLDIGVEEEDTEDEDEDEVAWSRPPFQQSQSFLDLSSRQSGDTMRDSVLFP